MGNRTAKFVSAVVGSLVAGVPLAAVSQNAPDAPSQAADCLASPKGVAPQGQHWFYRLERSTKRQCWYLRAAGGKDGAKTARTAQASTDTSPAATAPQQASVQDARAEYVSPRSTAAPKPQAAITSAAPPAPMPEQPAANQADSSAPQSQTATPWPDVSASTAPAPEPAPTVVAAAPLPTAKPPKPAAAPPPVATESASDRQAGSLQTLLLVIGGALALAGLLASVIYRFAGGRLRVQSAERRPHWDDRAPQEQAVIRAPWQDARLAAAPLALSSPVDFDAARPLQTAQLAAFSEEIGRLAARSASERREAIERDEVDFYDRGFEIEPPSPRLADDDRSDEEPMIRDEDNREEDVQIEDMVDVNVITAMLERLAAQGPQLLPPSPEAALANLARNQRGQSAARA